MKQPTKLATPLKTHNLAYMVQLDALRALAVFGVLITHFLPETLPVNAILQPGVLGVKLFFVLSGFLITGILLKSKDTAGATHQDSFSALKIFYIRRCLRILPIYFLTLIVSSILKIGPAKESLIWHFTYTSNFYFQIKGDWDDRTAHFWTLSVEEQFYLIWPFIILFLAKNRLPRAFLAAIVIAPLFRGLSLFIFPKHALEIVGNLQTLAFLDSFGLGAVLAYFTHEEIHLKHVKKKFMSICFWLGLPGVVALMCMRAFHVRFSSTDAIFQEMLTTTILSLFCTYVIARAAQGFDGIIGTLLEQNILVYFGKISYGIYVYHLFMPPLIKRIFHYLGLQYFDSLSLQFITNVVATLIVAIASYHLVENPINRLKRHFEYAKS